jgi:hypothetical protein
MQQLSSSKLRYFNANPSAATAIDSYVRGTSNYLAHEFLNQTWEPFYSIDVADEMAEAEIRYLGSATLVDNHPTLVVDALASEAVARLATPRLRQLAIDFAANQRFRRDVFVRSGAPVEAPDMSRRLHGVVIGTLANPEGISAKAKVPRGEIRFQDEFIRDLQSLLLAGSTTIGDALSVLGGAGRNAAEITRNLIFLVAAGTLMPFARAAGPGTGHGAEQFASAMVARVLADAIERRARRAVPSQILGNGVEIRPIEAVALLEWVAGAKSVEMLASRLEAATKRQELDPSRDTTRRTRDDEIVPSTREVARHVIENLVPSFTRLHLIV